MVINLIKVFFKFFFFSLVYVIKFKLKIKFGNNGDKNLVFFIDEIVCYKWVYLGYDYKGSYNC